ncbi:uncharacterized protein LOC111561763 [Felis catus]|uniref:uncharacterized protein LOC111561763 n=1 Tax=Felis catus TaxID=9685 RepID=UPI001D19F21D|nr:uncharacterized protein LOC111561763 [Felis catus]
MSLPWRRNLENLTISRPFKAAINDGIGPEEQQLLTSGFRTVQKPQTSRRLLAFFAQGCRSVHVDRLEENVQMFMVAAVGRTRGFRRAPPQDVSSPGPYLVKVFQDSVIQLRGAAAALGAGPATARPQRCCRVPGPPAAGSQARRARDRARAGDRRGPGPAPARTPARAEAQPALRGRLAQRAPRPDYVTFPVHPTVDSSSQRGSELLRCARLRGNDRSKQCHSKSGTVLNDSCMLTHLTHQCPIEADLLVNTIFSLKKWRHRRSGTGCQENQPCDWRLGTFNPTPNLWGGGSLEVEAVASCQ